MKNVNIFLVSSFSSCLQSNLDYKGIHVAPSSMLLVQVPMWGTLGHVCKCT